MLGAYDVVVNGRTIAPPATAKARSLLAYLALRHDESVRREAVMNEFWPEAEPANARNNLKTALSTVRRAFRDAGVDPDSVVAAQRDSIRWIATVGVDAREFERCSAELATERARALEIYRGELIPGDYAPWATELRNRLEARFDDVLRAELAAGGSPAIAERVLLLDPFCNDAYIALIEHALRQGNQREARAVYRRYVKALAEIGTEPSAELALRVGVHTLSAPEVDIGFVGREAELGEVRSWLDDPSAPNALLVSGLAGIGKSALVHVALRDADGAAVGVTDATDSGLRDAVTAGRTIVCARPEQRAAATERFPEAREIVLGPLTRDEVGLALARWNVAAESPHGGDTVWPRSFGHPLLVRAELARLSQRSPGGAAERRQRFSRDAERCFDAQLHAAGDDSVHVAELIALEPQLDVDDLAALLDWRLERAAEARDRLVTFGILHGDRPATFAFPPFADLAIRGLPPGRRHETIARIAERLTLHEHPSAKVRMAEHLVILGRERDAATAYLEAGRAFVAFAAWKNALAAFDSGIALLEQFATSTAATALLRELYLARGNALYHAGDFAASLHSLDSALDLADRDEHSPMRASALVTVGNALWRLNHVDAAWSAARQAEDESRRAADVRTELEATNLIARLLYNAARCEESVARASAGYERAMAAREWTVASTLAQRAADASRRLLHFADCYHWVQRQLEAAVLAGPVIEAQAHYGLGSVEYAVNRLDRALDHCREGLRLINGVRRRHTLTTLPLGLIEWTCHQALAHTYAAAGKLDDGLAECEWLVRSPWVLNTTACAAMTLATVVDVRLTADSDDDRRAAIMLAERIPPPPADDPAAFLDALTRARIATLTGPAARATVLLHDAYAAIVRAEPLVPDQIHMSYERLAHAARGIDDLLAARAAEAGRRHRQRVIEAAGPLWAASS